MIASHATFRWLMAWYLAVLMPVCCCFTSVVAAHQKQPGSLPDHAELAHDHGDHGGVGAESRHAPHEPSQGQQAPLEDSHPCGPGSHEHDGECDCGCSSGPDLFAVEAPPAAHLTFTPAPAFVPIIDSAPLRQIAMIRTATPCNIRNTSLLRLRCALIV